ncbi:MAG: hypothetical protein J7L92_02790 [Dehalococcoidia bacterium]|nr:hypothetical protein [Dehalococcoidia bacterium]
MENMKSFHDHLENLQSLAKKLTETELALNALFAEEEIRLECEDEASSLKALYRTIADQLDRTKYSESCACYGDTKANLDFSITGLAVKIIVATTKNQRAWNFVNNIFDTEGHKKPFGKVMVRVGPKGLPDDATVISISQSARESNRSEPEIMNKLQEDGYLLFSQEAFSTLVDRLVGDVREGRLSLPISRDKLVEIAGLNKPKPRIKFIEAE